MTNTFFRCFSLSSWVKSALTTCVIVIGAYVVPQVSALHIQVE
jgi:hypothetical protein